MSINKIECTKCNIIYPANLNFFPPDKRKNSGLSSWCRECYKEIHKNRKTTNKYKEKAAKRMQNFRINNKDKHLAYRRIHGKMRRRIKKPEECQICNEIKKIELASINHVYTENEIDWIYLCSSCHHLMDSLLEKRGDDHV